MSFHEDQIKKKLLDVDIDSFRKMEFQEVKLHKKSQIRHKKLPHLELSQWSTNQKATTFISFPALQTESQTIKKSKVYSPPPNPLIGPYLNKTNLRFKESQSSVANPINLSFNPEQTRGRKSKNKKSTSLLPRQSFKSQEKRQKDPIESYLINGQIKIRPVEQQQNENSTHRSSHLLRLLRQRQILRRKRYSFDIDAGFVTKSYFNL